MNNTERILASLERVLALRAIPPDIDGRELAQEYAALCQAANERLLQCIRHIESGNLRAAMHISESPPPLLDHCAALDFSGAAQWRDLVQQNNWPIADAINGMATQRINDAYSSAMALDPFLKQFSSSALNKNYRESTRLLRRIIELDPKTPTWPEDLKAFEGRRIPELMNELRQADTKHDLMKLNELLSELNEKWLDPRSKALKEQASTAVKRVQEKEAGERGLEIAGEISKYYAAFDYTGLARSLSAYQALLDKGHFKPTPPVALQFDEANAWFVQEKANKEKERQYQDNLAQLTTELEKDPVDAKVLEKLWRVLTSEGRSPPANLEQRTLGAIETCRLFDQRRRRWQTALIAAGAAIVLATVAALICRVQYNRLLAFYVPQLEQAAKQNDPKRLQALEASLQGHILLGQILHRSPLVQEWLRKEEATRDFVEQNIRRFKVLVKDLNRLARAGFTDDAKFVTGHKEASDIIQKTPDLKSIPDHQQTLDSLAEMRRVHWESTIAQKELEMQGIVTNILHGLPTFESIASGSLADLDKQLTALEANIPFAQDKATALQSLYNEREKQGSGALASLESAAHELKARRQAITERQSLIAKLDNAGSFPDYLAALQSYVDRFPRDRLTQAMTNALAFRKHYEYFTAPGLTAAAGLNTAQLESISDNTPPENYFWDNLLMSEVNYRKGIEQKWPEIKNSIQELASDKLMTGLIEFTFIKSPTEHIQVFAHDDFGKETTGGGNSDTTYLMGTVYLPKPDHISAEFKPLNHPGVRASLVANRKPMAHCVMLTNIIANVEKVNATEGSVFLLKTAADIQNNASITNALLKLRLVKFFLSKFLEMVGEGVVPDIDATLNEMEAIDDGNLDPFCINNPFVIDTAKKADAAMQKNFKVADLIGQFNLKAAIRRETIRRGGQWVGYVDFNDPTRLRLVSGNKAFEIWVLRPGTGSEMNVLSAAEWGPSDKFMIGEKLMPGEALFAAAEDTLTTRSILVQTCKETGTQPMPRESPAWPRVWPINRRQ